MDNLTKLRYWTFKILPLVYDDSLSYYEVLTKVTAKVNELIDSNNSMPQAITNEITKQLDESYATNINNKIDSAVNTVTENANNQIDELANEVYAKLITAIATDEGTNTFTKDAKSGGELIFLNNTLYKVTAVMPAGTNYIVGTNIVPINISEELKTIKETYISSNNEHWNERSSKDYITDEYLFWKDDLYITIKNIKTNDILYNAGDNQNIKQITVTSKITNLQSQINKNDSNIKNLQNGLTSEILRATTKETYIDNRVDNLIVSSGKDSSSEVIDARVGYDGNIYGTLGNAVREQITELKNETTELKSALVTPYDAKTVNLSGKEIIVGLELYNADITKIYGFSVIRALQTGAVIIRVQKRNSDNTGWDSAASTLCEYNVNNFDFSASKYKIVKVELEEKNNSGLYGYAYINVDTSTNVDLVNNPIDAVRINPVCFVENFNKEIKELQDGVEQLLPYDLGTTQDPGMEIIVGVELNGEINSSKVYGFSVIRALQTGEVIIRVQQMKDDMSAWDNAAGAICEFTSNNFDFSSGLYKIIKVKLEEKNSSGISGFAYLHVDTTTSVNLVNISYTKSRINPRYLNKDESGDTLNLEIVMPSSVYVATGNAHIFYPSQMIAQQELADLSTVLMYASMNNAYGGTYVDGKKIGTVYPNINGDQSIKIHVGNVTNDAKYIESEEKDVTVKTFQMPTNRTASILVIGDSFMDFPWITSSDASPGHNGRGILAQVDEFAERSSNVFTWLGTHTSYTTPDNKVYKTEAYGGWNESYFIGSSTYPYEGSNIPSPFYIDGVSCNFAKYFENNGTPDIVIFFLGMNGGNGSGINTMINAIHNVSASIKCIVCMVPPFFGERYNVDFYSGNSARMQQNENYISLFDQKENQNISIIPVHAMFHKTLHYIYTERPWTAYGDNTDSVKVCTNHHPNPDGAKTLARIIYQYICKWL